MNPFALPPDEWSGQDLEGAMLIETLIISFVVAFATVAVLGHVLVLQAALKPADAR
jgi:hypothetical protein